MYDAQQKRIEELEQKAAKEKQTRIKYQDIVYAACMALDSVDKGSCTQDVITSRIDKIIKNNKTLKQEVGRLRKELIKIRDKDKGVRMEVNYCDMCEKIKPHGGSCYIPEVGIVCADCLSKQIRYLAVQEYIVEVLRKEGDENDKMCRLQATIDALLKYFTRLKYSTSKGS